MSDRHRLFRLQRIPGAAAVAAVALGATGLAHAQAGNATNGQALYNQLVPYAGSTTSCSTCHGEAATMRRGDGESAVLSRINSAINGNRGDMGLIYGAWTQQQRADVAAYIASAVSAAPPPPFAPPPGTPPPPPAAVNTSPAAVTFNSTQVGRGSDAVNVLITNAGATGVTLATPPATVDGTHASDFLVTPPAAGVAACGSGLSLAPGTSCSIAALFVPSAVGTRNAMLRVSFQGGLPPREVAMQGTGIAAGSAPAPAPVAPPTGSAEKAGGGALGAAGLLGLLGLAALRRRLRA
jgi:mono/diheme cytochrome c family protein